MTVTPYGLLVLPPSLTRQAFVHIVFKTFLETSDRGTCAPLARRRAAVASPRGHPVDASADTAAICYALSARSRTCRVIAPRRQLLLQR